MSTKASSERPTGARRPVLSFAVAGVLAVVFSATLSLTLPHPLSRAEQLASDMLQRTCGQSRRALEADRRLALVRMDDSSAAKLGRPPWPRSLHARAVAALKKAGAKAVFFDLFFRAPTSPTEDRAMIDAFRAAGVVGVGLPARLAPQGVAGVWMQAPPELGRWMVGGLPARQAGPPTATQVEPPFKELLPGLAFAGHIAWSPDSDGVHRSYPMAVRVNDGLLPSLGVAMAAAALEVSCATVLGRGPAGPPTGEPPADLRPWVAFPPVAREAWPTVSYARLLEAPVAELEPVVKGRVCLIGSDTTGSDLIQTPFEFNAPGAAIHLSTARTVLAGYPIRSAPAWANAVLCAVPAVLVAAAAAYLAPVPFALASAALAALLALGPLALFAATGILSQWTTPGFGFLATFLACLLLTAHHESRRKAVLQSSLERYFGPLLASRLVRDDPRWRPIVRRKELTILFSDICGFTVISEQLDPDDLREMLSSYFDLMVPIVFANRGTVDKFIGDGMMALFGDLDDDGDHACRAARAALQMQQAVRDLSARLKARGLPEVAIRIGINTGKVTLGELGSSQRFEYSAIGREVNLASRLEGKAPHGGVLVSARTAALVREQFALGPEQRLALKGIDREMAAFQLLEAAPAPAAD